MSLLLLACLVATLITPYHFRLYTPILEYIGQTGAFQVVMELLPLSFRDLTDWLVIVLTIVAVFVLGWQRAWLPFPTLLLLMGTFLAFRARRDVWVLVLAAVFIVGEFGRFVRSEPSFGFTKLRAICVIGALTVSMYLIGLSRQISEQQLASVVARGFPVEAVKFINERNYSGPLYNDFNWGGYLIWALPRLLVSMDGRTNLHGDRRLERSVNTWSGLKGWESDPELMKARLVIGGVNRALTNLIRTDSRFKLVYEDAIAVVFVSSTDGVLSIKDRLSKLPFLDNAQMVDNYGTLRVKSWFRRSFQQEKSGTKFRFFPWAILLGLLVGIAGVWGSNKEVMALFP